MRLHFDPDLGYQRDAIHAACDLFRGQETNRSEFTVTRRVAAAEQLEAALVDDVLGIGNRLTLHADEIAHNLRGIQLRNGLAPSAELNSLDFTVEMETGTGKTYVYLRTIFELNRRYGFTKFVIVVPSVAIREGVLKTLDITKEHFGGIYNAPAAHFVYDSAKLGDVRDFATSPHIRIMVVTVQSIVRFGDEAEASALDPRERPTLGVIYRPSEKVGGERPIDLIHATNPIVIVDEPQSVEGRGNTQGAEAVKRLKPLATFRYSATHLQEFNRIYRLDAVDAYEQRLVKQIEVASATVHSAANKPFVRLVQVKSTRETIQAKIQLDVASANGVTRTEKWVQETDDLEQTSGGRAVYRDVRMGEIRGGRQSMVEIRHPHGETWLRKDEAFGDVDALQVQRQMIARTIRAHLEKERRLNAKGIKVLSLFFVERVELYRQYDAEGNPQPGEYARIFEEEFRRATNHPDFRDLFTDPAASENIAAVHDGYFSKDRVKVGGKSVEIEKNTSGATKADDDAYNLILKDKERLLSFETPLRFIFSHSALREGWDNPNVFQICALRDIQTERERRQSIGRGLRLCVNQEGDRQFGFDINTLTVIARESYEDFAEGLQQELSDPETGIGIKFGVVEAHQFAGIPLRTGDADSPLLGMDTSAAIWKHLRTAGYIDAKGIVQDPLRTAIKAGSISLPADVESQRGPITGILRKLAGRLEVKNADEKTPIRANREVVLSDDFRALWDRVKHKTTYRVRFDNERLIRECVTALRDAPQIAKTRMSWQMAKLDINRGGVEAVKGATSAPINLSDGALELPDILTELQNRTQLTRRSICRILVDSGRLEDFRINPQLFIDHAAQAINRRKQLEIIEGIKYQRIGEGEFWAQELFAEQELQGYLRNLVDGGPKSAFDLVTYDSEVEREFAVGLRENEAVKLFAKLPGWFRIGTPLGSYNPDWVVLAQTPEGEKLFFVVETKGTMFLEALREAEQAKIACGGAHFSALRVSERPAEYRVVTTVDELLA